MSTKFEFGPCECDNPGCGAHPNGAAPALVFVVRDHKRMRLCTRCTQTNESEVLIGKPKDEKPFWEYDALGAVVKLYDGEVHRLNEEQMMLVHDELLRIREAAVVAMARRKYDA